VILLVSLAAAWLIVLGDPHIARLLLFFVGAFGIALALIAAAMGLGLLGFGLFAAGDRLIGWLRRASRWPDE
jgi:hypothetical protein